MNRLVVLLLPLFAAACVLPGPRPEPARLLEAPELGAVATPAPLASEWWRSFGDPQLDVLVDEALQNSPTLALARARVAAATAVSEGIGTPRRPTIDGNASVARERYSGTGLFPPPLGGRTFTDAQFGIALDWDLDLWGRRRSERDAADLRAHAALIDASTARLLVTTATVTAYLEFDHAQRLLDTATASRDSRAALLRLTEDRRGAGLDTDVEVETARAAVASAVGDIAFGEERLELARNALAALTGSGPARGAALVKPQLGPAEALRLPAELPADLLARRPDIAADRLRIDAATSDTEAARAAFYPNVNLVGTLGLDTITPGDLLDGSSRFFNVGPALHLPLYGHSALRGNLHGAEASYAQAVATYNGAVVDAIHEVADATASLRALGREEEAALSAQQSLERAYALAELRYKSGLTNYLGVLIAQDRLLAQQKLVVDVRSRRAALSVDLIRALGGGFGG